MTFGGWRADLIRGTDTLDQLTERSQQAGYKDILGKQRRVSGVIRILCQAQ